MAEDKEDDNVNVESNNKITEIVSTLKWVLKFEHFVGIFRLIHKNGLLIPPTWAKKAYSLCLIVVYVGLYIIFTDLLPFAGHNFKDLDDMVDEIPSILILIQYITNLITTNFFFNKNNITMFSMLADLDNQLITTGIEEFYRNARVKAMRFVILVGLTYIINSSADLLTEDDIDIGVIIFLPLYLVQNIEIIIFCLCIETLKTRLDIVNGYIAKFLDEKDSNRVFTVSESKDVVKEKFNMIGRPSESNKKIRDLATMYDTIGSICSLTNNIFNLQIFMTLVCTFVYILITIWTSIYVYRTPEGNSGPLITITIRCFAILVIVVMMCFVCEKLRLTRNSTKILVNQIIMDYSLPKVMRVQAKAFMELIEAWPLHILIYDMFFVDITLMLKFISVSTTYLIVVIQISHFT